MTSLISIVIGVGLNYLPISKNRLVFVITGFLTGGVL